MIIFIAGLALALCVSFSCSLMEAALLSLTPTQVADLSHRHPKVGAIWRRFKENIEQPIAAILILNTTAHTIGAAVAGAQFDKLFGTQWLWLFTLVFTYAMLQYTEILPKTLGVHFNQWIAQLIAKPLSWTIWLFTPLIYVLHVMNRPFEGRRQEKRTPATLEQIRTLAAMARLSKHITPHQEQIIGRAAKLSQTQVQQVMIPIEQAAMLSTAQTMNQAMVAAHTDAHTRFPVYDDDDRNRLIGYVNFKEMVYFMRINPGATNLRGIVRPLRFVEPDCSVAKLLKTFVDQHEHLAVVRDAGGRCLGLVTLEDLIEEMVGELEDEFDRLPHHAHQLSQGLWMFGGGVPMREVLERLDHHEPAINGTLASWVDMQLDDPPKAGQELRYDGVALTIRRVRRGRVFEASVVAADQGD